jgi:hypothetical protein
MVFATIKRAGAYIRQKGNIKMSGIYQHRNVDIVVSQAPSGEYLVTWKFPDEDDAIRVYRPSESQALSYAKRQIDQFHGIYVMPIVVWRKGEDWWSGIEVENGVVPSDATPYEVDTDYEGWNGDSRFYGTE